MHPYKAKIGEKHVVSSGVLTAHNDEVVEIQINDGSIALSLIFKIELTEIDGSETILRPISDDSIEVSWKGSFAQGNRGTSSGWRKFAATKDRIYYLRHFMYFIGSSDYFTRVLGFTVAAEKTP